MTDPRLLAWSADRVEVLQKLWGEGKNYRQISDAVGMSRNAVIGKATRMGLRRKGDNPNRLLTRLKNRWTTDQLEALAQLWPTGLAAQKIGEQLGFSRSAVLDKTRKLGFEPRQRLTASAVKQAGGDVLHPVSPTPDGAARPSRFVARFQGNHFFQSVARLEASDLVPEHRENAPTIAELERHHCRWPIGRDADSAERFCGDPITRESYCARHYERAYHRVTPHYRRLEKTWQR